MWLWKRFLQQFVFRTGPQTQRKQFRPQFEAIESRLAPGETLGLSTPFSIIGPLSLSYDRAALDTNDAVPSRAKSGSRSELVGLLAVSSSSVAYSPSLDALGVDVWHGEYGRE